jgi:integrase
MIPRSKTDQLGQGLVVPVPEMVGSFSLGEALRAYVSSLNQVTSDCFLFRAWDSRRGGWKSAPLRATTWNSILRRGFQGVGGNVTSHSIRRGSATALIERGATYEQLRPVLGHRCAEAVFSYHYQSLEQRALLARNLS